MAKKPVVYMDYGATTPVDPRVVKKMLPYFSEKFANPSSSHFLGLEIKGVLELARKQIASFLNCWPDEIIFTGGGTEAENLAIKGTVFAARRPGGRIIISDIEHNAVMSSINFLSKRGYDIKKVSVDHYGNINIKNLKKFLNTKTILVSVMLVNNEVGTMQPISRIAGIIKRENRKRSKKNRIKFHVDAEAGAFYLDCNVKKLGVDSLSINGSKIYAPKGIGALFVKRGILIASQISGGGQERFRRGGTENVPGIVALAEAVKLAQKERTRNIRKIKFLKDYFVKSLLKKFPQCRLNTPRNSLPNYAHVTFLGNYSNLAEKLSRQGIAASKGSACAANMNYRSHVLKAMGFSNRETDSSLRFSFGKYNTITDVRYMIKTLEKMLK